MPVTKGYKQYFPSSQLKREGYCICKQELEPHRKNVKNYSSFKLEFLALVWAVTKKSAEYLHCAQFVVYTDNNPFVYLSSAKLGSLEQRWVARLASFQFENKYRPGRINQSADALSRFPSRAATLDAEEEREGVEILSFAHVRTVWPEQCVWGQGRPTGRIFQIQHLECPFILGVHYPRGLDSRGKIQP